MEGEGESCSMTRFLRISTVPLFVAREQEGTQPYVVRKREFSNLAEHDVIRLDRM